MKKRLVAVALLTLCMAAVARGQCSPQFVPGYDYGRLQESLPSALNSIFCAAVFDDHSGPGPALFIGGYLTVLGDQGGSWMAKLVGDRWVAVPGFNGPPRCMSVIDDGSGPVLYVGGSFTVGPGGTSGCLVKWDGAIWSGMGLAANQPQNPDNGLYALAWHDDGNGPSLFAGGCQFGPSGQPNPSLVMRFDGAAWHSLGTVNWQGSSAFDPLAVRTMVTFDAGSGPRLVVGGSFNTTPAGASNCVAVWDGTSWLPGGSGLSSAGAVKSLAVHQGLLFAAGDAGPGYTAIWRWNGAAWESAYGSNADFPSGIGGTTLLSYDDGSGPALYGMVGIDSHCGAELVALRNGVWQTYGPPLGNQVGFGRAFMTTLVAAPIEGQTTLVAVGRCTDNGGVIPLPNVAAWTGAAWRAVEPVGRGVAVTVSRILSDPEADDGSVYIGNLRYSESGVGPSGLPLLLSPQATMVRWHHGGVSELVITDSVRILSNSGSGWQPLLSSPVDSTFLTVARDTGEESLVASDGQRVYRLGSSWTQLGSSLSLRLAIASLASYDNGQGSRLFIGGSLGNMGSVTNCRLAYYDGSQWQPVPGVPGRVVAMTVFDVGDGPELFLACKVESSDPTSRGAVVRWNGTRLDDLTANLGSSVSVSAMIPFDDGAGQRLWIACPHNPLGDLAFWGGSAWQSRPNYLFNQNTFVGGVSLADVRRSNGTRSLMIGGTFTQAGGQLASNLAELATCPRTCNADFNGDGDTATDADIEAFFACISGDCCAQCGSPDFNNDGQVGTDQDIESFFRVLAGGPC